MGSVRQAYTLDGIYGLMARLGNVQDRLKVIHIAGTNGKGSVGAFISAVLSAQGYRTGTYASPAVIEKREIIRLDGELISQADFCEIMSDVQKACEEMGQEDGIFASEFEAETAAAFCYFYRKKCDFAVIEAGLGGRDDATNIIKHPVCSVFTSISIDHKNFLGDTLKEIAAAKAGIIKPGCPCVSGVQSPEALSVLKSAAMQAESPFYAADTARLWDYRYDGAMSSFIVDWEDGKEPRLIRCAMTGAFQRENFACALEALFLLRKLGVPVSGDALEQGFYRARLPGRFEKIMEAPAFYIDGGHNEGAARQLARTVRHCFWPGEEYSYNEKDSYIEKDSSGEEISFDKKQENAGCGRNRLVYIIGMLADKEYEKVLPLMLPYASLVFTVTPQHPRALDGQVLALEARRFYARMESEGKQRGGKGRPEVFYVPDISEAAARAVRGAGARGVVLAFGSFSFLKQLVRWSGFERC